MCYSKNYIKLLNISVSQNTIYLRAICKVSPFRSQIISNLEMTSNCKSVFSLLNFHLGNHI